MKKATNLLFRSFLAVTLVASLLTGCGDKKTESKETNAAGTVENNANSESGAESEAKDLAKKDLSEVTILYTNDVHTYINNQETDDDGNVTKLISYASVAALRDELVSEGKNVLLVDAGDHSQGTAYGGMDEGKSIIEIMNATGYQLATLGNHEFDYGIFRTFAIMEEADFPYVSCNFYTVEDGKSVLPGYEILEIDGVKIAFVGISTPETITKSTPTYFMDESGENFIYNFYSGEDGSELYQAVQDNIDEARNQADYVIGLGHLGVDPASEPYRSIDVIANTTGLDAFIDGHSHTVMECEKVKDAAGNTVVLTQTGSYLSTIGEMIIAADGSISTRLITEYDGKNEEVEALEDAWISSVDGLLGEQIAVLDNPLYIMSPENPELRLIRSQETNLGDLDADAYYYYFNEVMDVDCDIAIANGGGIRSDVDAGDVSYMTAKTVNPFGNVACLVEVSGQNILDALEKGASKVGLLDEEKGIPAENGGFLQVAGITYEIDSSIESSVQVSEDGLWLGKPTGEYKVCNVMVYNREKAEYEPLDLDKTYTLAGVNYVLRNQGDGMAMFKDSVVVVDYVDEDYLVLAAYLKAFAKEGGETHIATKNSPLAAYDGYLLDYENPYGAGRIVIK